MINVAPRTVEEVWQIAELVKGESLAPARRRPAATTTTSDGVISPIRARGSTVKPI